MSPSGLGALLGFVAGMGALLVLSWVSSRRPAPVGRRIAPYVSGGRAAVVGGPWTGIAAWAALADIVVPARWKRPRRFGLASGDAIAWACCGAVSAALLSVLLKHDTTFSPGIVAMSLLGGMGGALGARQYRSHRARVRRARITAQLPTAAELLAFAVAAGQTPIAAVDRVAQSLDCELADELRDVVIAVRAGDSVESALRAMATRIDSPAVWRFVDGLLVAMERGTPLAELLRAQAADCRADERRHLLELAGRKDVGMLVPVVFLILPTVVLVALFPGVTELRLVVA